MHDTKFIHWALMVGTMGFTSPALAATTVHVTLTDQMELKLETNSVKAGRVVFDVKNDAQSQQHEVIIAKLKDRNQPVSVSPGNDRVDEKRLRTLGEVSDLDPGKDGKLSINLKPGEYLLFCNMKGHYQAGMLAHLTVTQ
jgi:uncharacterized cupredoxin-like copper-binding protein